MCDRVLCGESAELTEQHIGIEVFKRQADYSTTEDNVVRAQARQVRVKLAEYFSSDGKDEPLLLEIPKGSYVPVFSARRPAALDLALPDVGARRPAIFQPNWAIAAAVICLVGFLAVLWDDRQVRAKSAAVEMPALIPPFSWVFDSHQPTTIVVADSSFGIYQDLIGRAATLDEYLDSRFFEKNPPSVKDGSVLAFSERLSTRQFTSFGDLVLTNEIMRLASARGEKVSVRFARDLHLREIATGNFIFIGSPYSNPWVSLFANKRNFPTSLDPVTRRGVVTNRQAHAGEPEQFLMKGEDGRSGPTYGVLTFLPSGPDSGNILLLDGLNMEGTEAAGAFVTDSRAGQSLLEKVGLTAKSPKCYLEVVVETKAMAGTSRDSAAVAYRVGKPKAAAP